MALALTLPAACAEDPVRWRGGEQVPAGRQKLRVEAYGYEVDASPSFLRAPPALGAPSQRLAEVACTLRNDKGSWSVVAPGEAIVELSPGKLSVRCTKDGYLPAEVTVSCITPDQARAIGVGTIPYLGPIFALGALAVLPAGPECYYRFEDPVRVYLQPRP